MKESTLVYIGTYTQTGSGARADNTHEGIYVYRLDLSSGEFTLCHTIAGVMNPSFLAFGPEQRFVYAVNELQEIDGAPGGAVSAFSRDAQSGALTFLNRQSAHGADPCHVTVTRSGQHLLVSNYTSGSVCVLPVLKDGSIGEACDVKRHHGSSINPERQTGPHAHSLWFDDENSMAFVADLGLDRLVAYTFDPDRGKLQLHEDLSVNVKPGAGPRHFACHPNRKYVYMINELDSSLELFAYDPAAGRLTPIQTISTLPAGFDGENICADVHVSPSGRHLYGSNRGHDSIVIYRIAPDTGKLECAGHCSTQGRTPRNFAIDPTGQFLLAANQDSDSLVSFRIDRHSGELQPTGFQAEIPRPVCIKILP